MKFSADLHIHSKYSRAASKDMDLDNICAFAKWKGIDVVGTGDFTHPFWFSELKKKLKPDGRGLFDHGGIKFMLTTEICNIFHHDEKVRKVHSMIFVPDFEQAEKINARLGKHADLMSDGRPVLTTPVKSLAETVFSVSKDCALIPSHAWTPWFSVFGANSGFDTLEECFGEYSRNIFAIETGLSSDPAMNRRLSRLDRLSLVSNSDAHCPSKLGRELNMFDTELSFKGIMEAVKSKDPSKFLFTVEFFPEEGKYYHGILDRIDKLSDRPKGYVHPGAIPFKSLIPLNEIIAEVFEKKPDSAAVKKEYIRLVSASGSELSILLDVSLNDLARSVSDNILEGISRVRQGRINIEPGYDGQYGTIKIFNEPVKARQAQIGLF